MKTSIVTKSLFSGLYIVLIIGLSQVTRGQILTFSGKTITKEAMDGFIERQMGSLQIPALSLTIINKGEIVYQSVTGIINKEGDPVDSLTLFEAASMTKPVFSYVVIRLAEKEILDLDTPLYKYLPNYDLDYDDRYKLITAKMVLSHTSGLPGWRKNFFCDLILDTIPGTKYIYSNEGFEYLGDVIKHITGRNLQDIFDEEIFTPFNINNSYLISNDYVNKHIADGKKNNNEEEWGRNCMRHTPHMSHSLFSESHDYSKFIIGLMKESKNSQSTFNSMSTPQFEYEPGKSICLGIRREETPFGVKYHHGGNNANRYNSRFEFWPDSDFGYVYFMNCNRNEEFSHGLKIFLQE